MRNNQLFNLIVLMTFLAFCGCKYNQKKEQAKDMSDNYVYNNELFNILDDANNSQELMIKLQISENLSNRIIRFFNVNNTRLNIVFKNISNNEIVIQDPIGEWNLFLKLFDNKNERIDSKTITFIEPLIDDSFYIVLKPNESKVFNMRISYFGNYKTSFKKIRRLRIDYMAQPDERNANFYNIIEKSSAEIEIN